MAGPALNATLNLSETIGNFAAHSDIRHALLLTYNFDGPYLEDAEHCLLETLWQRNCENVLVIRDGGKVILGEKRSHRYRVMNAAYSTRVFHSKLILLVAESEVMAMIGSANLTRGGLATNLEIGHVYHLSRSAGPRRFFELLVNYLDKDLRRELEKTSPQQQAAYDLLVRDVKFFVQDVTADRSSVEPILLHNYHEPLLPQIARNLPGRHLDALWVVSPFFESDQKSDDPTDVIDDTLLGQILDPQTFTPIATDTPWIHIYFHAANNATALPVNLLERYKSQITLYTRNCEKLDPRTLHAKLLVFIGRTSARRDAQPFVAVVHGSANFTRAALISVPPEGNAEIVVLTLLPRPAEVARKLADYFNLLDLFDQVHDWQSLQSQSPKPPPAKPAVHVWECLISLADKKVTVFFEVKNANAQCAKMTLQDDKREHVLGHVQAPFESSVTFDLPDDLFETRTEPGYRRLPYHYVLVEVFDANDLSLGASSGPINVDRPEEFFGDWQGQPVDLRLDNQIYLAGVGQRANYQAMRKQLERIINADTPAPPALLPTHQADLDLFFRRVHIGLRGLRWRVKQTPDSLYVRGDVLRQLARWVNQVVSDESGEVHTMPFSPEQKLYLCDRLIQAALECAAVTGKLPGLDRPVAAIVRREFIEQARAAVQYLDRWRRDPALGVFAQGILKRWNKLVATYEDRP